MTSPTQPEIRFHPIASDLAEGWRAGAADAYGLKPEKTVCNSASAPCRHCLQAIPEGEPMLTLAHRPFDQTQPYAETGPIFLCGEPCAPYGANDQPPAYVRNSQTIMVRGYGADDRIVYGTGEVVPSDTLQTTCRTKLADPRIAYLHVRSASNNCYLFRIDRA